MPPRPSSSQSDGSGPTRGPSTGPNAVTGAGVGGGAGAVGGQAPGVGPGSGAPSTVAAGGMVPQPAYASHHPYKPPHYPPQPYPYPPRNHHPYPYPGYRPPPPHPPHPHPPQHYPPLKQPLRHMGPPAPAGAGVGSGPPGVQHEGAMPPPTAPAATEGHDNGPAAPATALVTTGPDGAPLDEGSQQSTLSNASAASGEEPCGTSKSSRKDGYGAGSAAPSPSPGGASHSSAHDDYDASPSSWPRPPSSPCDDARRLCQKSDSLGKLYEMDDAPERRGWVERLLAFMEERRTPIAACPTISKQPLDLYRLYLLVRERGGFVEVTKNKTWKDIAGLLGIGASSSAAYTLRKHYTKNLLAYECQFDRGGIDPQPIINQVEASTKKKNNKANSQPSPGSSNSQESFGSSAPGVAGSAGAPMDGYGGQYGAYPPQPNQSQGGGPGGDNLAASNPFDEPPGPRRPPGYQQGYGYEYGSPYPSNRPVYPPYGPEGDRNYASSSEYGRYSSAYGSGYRPGPAGGAPPPAGTPPPSQPYPDYYRPPPPQPEDKVGFYPPIGADRLGPCAVSVAERGRLFDVGQISGGASPSSVNVMGSQLARQLVAPLPPPSKSYPHVRSHVCTTHSTRHPFALSALTTDRCTLFEYTPRSLSAREVLCILRDERAGTENADRKDEDEYGGGKGMGPAGAAAGSQPRRHPDFANKEGGGPPYNPPRPSYQPWPPGQFPRAPASPAPPHQQPAWRPPPGTAPPPPPPGSWPGYQPQGQPGSGWGSGAAPGAPRPAGVEPYPPASVASPGPAPSSGPGGPIKRELTFPPECIEATVPSGEKRRRLTKADVAPVDAWRIMMALKSGLLAETCWALDILNILLFDDNCIGYFGLQHMPGLLDLLLEHFHKSLSDVFDAPTPDPKPWYAPPSPEPAPPAPRTTPTRPPPDPTERVRLLSGENYTLQSRRRHSVTYRSDDELFAPDNEDDDCERVDDAVLEPWQFGGDAALAQHVMPCFQGEFVHLPFVRVMDSSRVAEPSPRSRSPIDERFTEPRVEGPERTDSTARAPDPSPRDPHSPRARPAHDADCDNLELEPMDLEPERKPALSIRDPGGVLKRRRLEDYEDECYTRDEPSLNLVNESRDALAKRCVALSNILRGLTFVPGNEAEFSRSGAFLALAGKLLLLHHEHAPRAARSKAYERAVRDDADVDACCSSLHGENEWWWETLAQLREDALVCCANIAGSVELSGQPEAVARPLLDGLLHWSVCPAAVAADAPAHAPPSSPLSPRRLALEALCKLCVTDANVDLVLATPPRARISALCASLARDLCRPEKPVVREFAVNLLHYMAGAGSGAAREVALHAPTVSQLVAFIERAEQAALGVANQHGVSALRDNPDAMGTSLDMLRRAAATLLRLAEHPANRALIRRHERRLLSLVMSQILDQKVAHELADVLYQCGRQRPADADTVASGSATLTSALVEGPPAD
ncbi:Trithorax group protein osa [Eumeta japonica]|uniref:Trithorax group protein osa n=1 Tax=Eumeta variegata TaxID=151549 RepID=A0A4C1SE93_EUMVA|nr:Trithorax group protein osa [Eumeta japonica]